MYRIDQMTTHFPAAMVGDYAQLVSAMETAPSDRHVLAAAVRGRADVIVTENTKDFPIEALAPYEVLVCHQDTFLLDQLELDAKAVRRALVRQVSRYRRKPRTITDLLAALGGSGNGCPRFAQRGLGGSGSHQSF